MPKIKQVVDNTPTKPRFRAYFYKEGKHDNDVEEVTFVDDFANIMQRVTRMKQFKKACCAEVTDAQDLIVVSWPCKVRG